MRFFDLEPSHTAETPRLRRIKNPASHHPFYARFLRDKRILDIVEQLLGPGIRINSNKLNMKSSGGGSAVEWHQDWAFIPHTNDSILTLGIAVDDLSMENGPLLMIPGSHKGPNPQSPSERYVRCCCDRRCFFSGRCGSDRAESRRSIRPPYTGAARLVTKHIRPRPSFAVLRILRE